MGRYRDSKRDSRIIDSGARYLDPNVLFETVREYDVDAHEEHESEHCGCTGADGDGCDGYGRCSTISEAHLTKAPDMRLVMFEMLYRPNGKNAYDDKWNTRDGWDPYNPKFGIDPFFAYAVERILCHTGVRNMENWKVEVSRGYYGEEVNGISLKSDVASDAYENLVTVFGLDDPDDLVKHVLKVEYGYLLPVLERKLRWNFEVVDRGAIVAVNGDHYKRLGRDIVKSYEKYTGPRGLAVATGEDRFRLLDGYHRFAASEGSDAVSIIVGRP